MIYPFWDAPHLHRFLGNVRWCELLLLGNVILCELILLLLLGLLWKINAYYLILKPKDRKSYDNTI